MVQLKVLNGKQAGTSWVARRFPVRIGRGPKSDLRLEEPGVWEDHAQLQFSRGEGVVLIAEPRTLASVNGQPVHRALLRNGDDIDLGGLKLQFWLSETRQKPLAFRELLTWTGLAVISLAQIALIYWLIS